MAANDPFHVTCQCVTASSLCADRVLCADFRAVLSGHRDAFVAWPMFRSLYNQRLRCETLSLQETEGAETMSKLGALEADIQAVTHRLARISSDALPALPASLEQAMALANSRKRKSCEVLPSSQLVGGPEAKRGHSLDNSQSGGLLGRCQR